MEKVTDYLDTIETQLAKIEDVFEDARGVPFSTRVSVSKQEVYDIIDEMRSVADEIRRNLPNEIRTAQRVAQDRDKILSDAKQKATMIVKDAQEQSEKLISDHEIIRQASARAQQTESDSRRSSAQLRKNAIEYSDELLAKTEDAVRAASERFTQEARQVEDFLSETANTLYANRKELRGIKE